MFFWVVCIIDCYILLFVLFSLQLKGIRCMFIKLFKIFTDSAGWFYSNSIRKDVKLFGAFSGTYSSGSKSSDGKKHFIFLNDEDAQAEGENLPDVCYLDPETGTVLSEKEYRTHLKNSPTESSVESDSAFA